MASTPDSVAAAVTLRQRRRLDEAARFRSARAARQARHEQAVAARLGEPAPCAQCPPAAAGSTGRRPMRSPTRRWGQVLVGRIDLRVLRGG
jgi:hypothetical protein